MIPLTVICPECKSIETIEVESADLNKFVAGMSAILAFPYLTKDQHERLISGICKKCWNWLFSNNDVHRKEKPS